MKIKEIKKYPVMIKQEKIVLYEGLSDDAPDNIKKLDIKQLVLEHGTLKIEV